MKNSHYVMLVALSGAAALSSGTAAAQTDADIAAAGRACLAIDSRELRLACFEGIFSVPPADAETAAAVAESSPLTGESGQSDNGAAGSPLPEVTIVEVREIRPGDARFLTQSGRVYHSTGSVSSTTRYPETPFTATLESGAFGSEFLRYGPENYQRVRVAERD